MLIKRILVASTLMFGVLHAHAASDGTDNHCVIGKNNSLFNQCNYSVDVGFCVENPQQTKHFFDNSKAFECPGGALIALPAGLEDGNILHGKVHWWACSTKHRGSFKWRFVEGVGYRGYCFKEGADQAQTVRNTAPAAPAGAADCRAMESRLRPPSQLTTHQMRRADAVTALEYLDRNCGNLSPQQRAGARKMHQENLIAAVAECRQSGSRNCDSSNDVPGSRSTAQRPVTGESRGTQSVSGRPAPTGTAATGSQPVSGLTSSQTCESMKQSIISLKVPNTSVTAMTETLMFMIRTEVTMIDEGCQAYPGMTSAQIAEIRKMRMEQLEWAESQCELIQSAGRRCVPKAHPAEGTEYPGMVAGRPYKPFLNRP